MFKNFFALVEFIDYLLFKLTSLPFIDSEAISVGIFLLLKSPSPSYPLLFSPHAYTSPFSVKTSV